MIHKIEVEDLVLQVEITDLTDIKGNPNSWDSPEDYYGCRELEFTVVSGVRIDEDGTASDLGRNECAAAAEMHAELIEDLLWQEIDDQAESDAIDRAEARASWRAA